MQIDPNLLTLPKFTVVADTGAPRAIIETRPVALRVQDYFTKQDMILHTIRLTTDEDEARMDVMRGGAR